MSDPVLARSSIPVSRPHPQAATVLVLGIVGVVVPFVSFAAWFLGNRALRDVEREPTPGDRAQDIRVGRMLGKVFSILTLLWALVCLGIVAFYVLPHPGG